LKRTSFYLLYLGLPIGIGGFVAAGSIIPTIFGSNYLDSVPVFRALILTAPIEFLTLPVIYVLGAIHRQRNVVMISSAMAVFNVGINVILIPRFGALGAAYSALCTSFIFCAA